MPQTTTAPRKKTRLMTEGSIFKNLLLFAVPLILGNLLQQLYNTADSIIVGNFVGSNALAAVGSSGSPIFLLIGFSQGTSPWARAWWWPSTLGAKDREDAQIAVHTSLAIAAILGVVLTVGGILVCRSLLVWMNTPAEVLEDAVTYMQIYFGGVLFSVIYNMAAGILNAAGNSQRSHHLPGLCLHHQHHPRPRSHCRAADGCGGRGHRHRYQPAGVLHPLPPLPDAGGG